jgi:hypothetical protein
MKKRPYDTSVEVSGRLNASVSTVAFPGPSHDSPHATAGIPTTSSIYARPQPYVWHAPAQPLGYGVYTPNSALYSGVRAEFELTGKVSRVDVALSPQSEGPLWRSGPPQPRQYSHYSGTGHGWYHAASVWPPGFVPEARVPFEPQFQPVPGTFPLFGSPSAPPGTMYPTFSQHQMGFPHGYPVEYGPTPALHAPDAFASLPTTVGQPVSAFVLTPTSTGPTHSSAVVHPTNVSTEPAASNEEHASASASSGWGRDNSELNDEDIEIGPDKSSETIPTMPGVRVIRSASGQRKLMCSQSASGCNLVFGGVFELRSHLREAHGIRQPYQCLTCRQFFSSKAVLETHNRTHTGDKPFTCHHPGCTAAFAQKSNLKRHYRVHSGERPVSC